jgi:hypothetical protein
MKAAARLAFEFLRGEGLSPERIAGVAKSTTSAVRQWARGMDIPSGAATRMVIAARVIVALKPTKVSDGDTSGSEIAAFARGWLAARAREIRGAGLPAVRSPSP